jgi:hypothetical protein
MSSKVVAFSHHPVTFKSLSCKYNAAIVFEMKGPSKVLCQEVVRNNAGLLLEVGWVANVMRKSRPLRFRNVSQFHFVRVVQDLIPCFPQLLVQLVNIQQYASDYYRDALPSSLSIVFA